MASEGLAKLARVVAGEPVAPAEAVRASVEAVEALEASEALEATIEASEVADVLKGVAETAFPHAEEGIAEEAIVHTPRGMLEASAEPDAIADIDTLRGLPDANAELDGPDPDPDAPYEENDEPGAIEIVDELCFDAAVDESDGAPSAPAPAVEDPFARLIHALEGVAIAQGAGEESVTCVRALFGVTRSDGMAPGERATEALLAAGIVVESAHEGRGLVRSGAFTAQVVSWQGILRGESEDFAACGGGALDEWAASVLARVLGSPSKAESLRRELRGRGVAAFGLLADVA
jgi:hypothetical protein